MSSETSSQIASSAQLPGRLTAIQVLVAAFLGSVFLILSITKVLDYEAIMIRPDRLIYLIAIVLEALAGASLLFFSGSRRGWILALALGLAFTLYSWIDDVPMCRCMGSFKELDRQERYLIALLITTLACVGLATLRPGSAKSTK